MQMNLVSKDSEDIIFYLSEIQLDAPSLSENNLFKKAKIYEL